MKTKSGLTAWQTGLVLFFVTGIAVLTTVLWPLYGAISAPGWSTVIDISKTTWGSFSPEIALDSQSYSHAVWYGDGETSTDWAIWYSNNRSGSWSTPKKITTGSDLRSPRIAVDPSDGLHVVYEDRGAKEIMYVSSTDHGQTWSSKLNLSSSPGNGYEPDIWADPDGNLHATWTDSRWTGSYQATYARRTGGSWGSPMRVQSGVGFNKMPRVTTTGSGANLRVHVTFYGKASDTRPNEEYEVYYVRGTGTTWESPVNITRSPGDCSYDPDIFGVGGNHVYIVWDESKAPEGHLGYHDIFLVRSTDNGTSWPAPVRITEDSALSRFPTLAYGQDLMHLLYDTDAAGSGDVFYLNYDPATGGLSTHVNLSSNSAVSKESAAAVDRCRVAASWMDKGTNWNVLYTNTPDIPPGPCDGVTPTATSPTATSSPTPATPTPTATPDPRPHGWVDIQALQPPHDTYHTRQLTVTLYLWAASDIGADIPEMRFCNSNIPGGCSPLPDWEAFASVVQGWRLLDSPYTCEWKYVLAWFRDDRDPPNVGGPYADAIQYDSFLTASMVLNDGNAYTNRTMVMVNSTDLDSQVQDCTGLRDMRLKEDTGITYTIWISYFPRLYFFLAPEGAGTRTLYAQYRDYAGNTGTFSDSIMLDTNPPFSGTPPTLNGGVPTTTHLLIPVSGLQAFDLESGVANVWLANRVDGPWMTKPYCSTPPCTYPDWNLAYGGPPIQYPALHRVYVRYEDASGYGPFPGNLSTTYSATISVSGISNIYLPLVLKDYGLVAATGEPAESGEVGLILVADPEQAGPGQEVLLWLAARRTQSEPLEGTLRLTLPPGMRVVRAWSAYGQLTQVSDRQVLSLERASSSQVPWILVQARLEEGAGAYLQVEGDMTWDWGSVEAPALQIENR